MHYADSTVLYENTVNGWFSEAEQALRRTKPIGDTQLSSALRRLATNTLESAAVPLLLRFISRVCVGLALLGFALALWRPVSFSALLNVGIAGLLLAFLSSLWRHYVIRSPIPVRGGNLISIDEHPVAYRAWFLLASAVSGFMLYVLLQAIFREGAL